MAETFNESQVNVIDSIEAVPEERLYIHEMESDKDAVSVASHAVDAIVCAVQAVHSIYSIVPPNDGSAFRYGHHFEPVDFVIDHVSGHHDAHSTGSCQRASPVSRRDRAAAVRGLPVRRRSGADIPRSDAPGIASVCKSKPASQMEREFGCRQGEDRAPGRCRPLAHQPGGTSVGGADGAGRRVSVGARREGRGIRAPQGRVADRLRQPRE